MLRWIVLAHLLSGLMIFPYRAHIHITSQTFTVSNLPGGFTSGLMQSCITYVTRIGKALLNRPSHGRNIRHIFFKTKVLYSCRRRSIMQCSIRNQCSDLFTCIINYLHVLYMIFMILGCVLCMTLMVLIYVYYRLYACINLVDVISFFRSIYRFLIKISRVPVKTIRKSSRRFSEKTSRFIGVPNFHCSSIISGTFRPNFSNFY
jgi:hypothetical protein